jgi:hypothetical protein
VFYLILCVTNYKTLRTAVVDDVSRNLAMFLSRQS